MDKKAADYWHSIAQSLTIDPLPTGWELVVSSASARVVYHSKEQTYFKEFFPRTAIENLKSFFVGDRAKRARDRDAALQQAGFNSPTNLCYGVLSNKHPYLISRAVPGLGVTTWCRQQLAEHCVDNMAQRRLLFVQLGHFIGRLHSMGFTHGDLRANNILATFSNGTFEFALIDNERTVRAHSAAGNRILRNLMQLNMLLPTDISLTDRCRFFRAWRQEMPQWEQLEAKILAVESYRWAMRRLAAKGLV